MTNKQLTNQTTSRPMVHLNTIVPVLNFSSHTCVGLDHGYFYTEASFVTVSFLSHVQSTLYTSASRCLR